MIQIVNKFTFNDRTSWRDVVKSFPSRSLQQCKSIFRNSVKQQLMPAEDTSQWSREQLGVLYIVARFYRKDWALVQENYYREKTTMELAQVYARFEVCFEEFKKNMGLAQHWDGVTPLFTEEEAKVLYNTAVIQQYRLKLLKISTQYEPLVNLRKPKVYPVECYLSLEGSPDLIEMQVLTDIDELYNVKRIISNMRTMIENQILK